MKKREIFDRLNREFAELTPDASAELIGAPIVSEKREEREKREESAPALRKLPSFSFSFRKIAATAAALAVTVGVVAAVVAFFPRTSIAGGYIKNDTFIALSINPALSVIADSDGKVVEITTKNRDAEILLAGTDRTTLIGRPYDETVLYLTEEAVSLGYFAAANDMSVAAVSCGGEKKTQTITRTLKSGAESVLSAKGVAVSVTTSVLDRGGVLNAAKRVDPKLNGDEDLEDLLEVLSRDADYLKKFGGEIDALFGEEADRSVQTLYQMELLDDYVDLLEERREFLGELREFNAELAADDNDAVKAAYELTPGEFSAADGWWLSWYANGHKNDDEELTELAEEFAELFEDYEEYELDGLEPLLRGNKPNVAAADKLSAYLSVYSAVNFEELEEYVDELEDLLDDLNETNYEKITAEFDHLLAMLKDLGADWEHYASSRGGVNGVEDYLNKTKENIREIYHSKKGAAGQKI